LECAVARLLNDAINGMLPTSVAGGENAAGKLVPYGRILGTGSVMLRGFLALNRTGGDVRIAGR